ncbi:PIN domain-containing protein [Rhodoblastus acidophilus]|uniref:Ribonuclease VapC n=1 Tax=Rhodoblastus acidophilus TaxID=1074 RepID=A0A6N8DK76_RHOAC|nr:type II toxin-antitoxin system VapC family toxin [Rhodoblastus acidophilus]MCW2274010.1 ribonuclease VapC [Rhodoblastus acidophilus]MTV30849.1 PIN domain-containing protein [Rhodoblastus acidophilus]
MIAVDTSALVAIVLNEPESERCASILTCAPRRLISAANVAEALIVANRRAVVDEMQEMFELWTFDIVDVTASVAHRAAEAYRLWGKGFHAAALNYGDCFAYDLAKNHACALLYVGKDFALTDVLRAQESTP